MKYLGKPQSKGITLIELMIVIAIVAILATVGYPLYQSQMRATKRSDGQAKLMQIMQAQQKFYSNNSRYTASLVAELNFTDAGGGAVASDEGAYIITAGACPSGDPIAECVELTAVGQGAQAADGDLTYNSLNQKTPVNKW